MSNPTLPPINPRLGLMFAAAHHLLPLFRIGTIDDRLARQMAVSAIESYEPQTRADYVNAARIIAFSMTALALLGKTTNPDMPMPEQMRAYGRANALNRSADQSERTMMQRRRLQKANPPGERPDLIGPNPTIPDSTETPDPTAIDNAEVQAAVDGIMREYESIGITAPIKTATPKPPQPQVSPMQPPTAPFHYNGPRTQPQATPYKQELLRNSALHRVAGINPGSPA